MGLFDDILKKPNPPAGSDPLNSLDGNSFIGSGSGQPPQDDTSTPMVIEKSSESTIFGAETEANTINAMNASTTEPIVHAETDTSSILMSSTPTPTVDATPSLVIVETPVAPVAEVIPTIVTSTPIVRVAPVATIETPTPIMETPSPLTPEPMNPIETPVVANNASIFDSIMTETPVAPTVDILSQMQAEAPIAAPVAPVVAVATPEPTTTPTQEASIAATHSFSTPLEFIEKSLANIDLMLANIDARHDAKEAEEASYRIEKLRFTDLEKNAHREKIIMDKERDHAIHMKKILETELKKDEENKNTPITHVESTLSEIGNEHPIHKHTHKKTESSKVEA